MPPGAVVGFSDITSGSASCALTCSGGGGCFAIGILFGGGSEAAGGITSHCSVGGAVSAMPGGDGGWDAGAVFHEYGAGPGAGCAGQGSVCAVRGQGAHSAAGAVFHWKSANASVMGPVAGCPCADSAAMNSISASTNGAVAGPALF